MTFEKFEERTINEFERRFEDCIVDVRDVRKNNGIVLRGVTVRGKDCLIAPTIYLEDFYEKIENGENFDDVFEIMLSIMENAKVDTDFNIEFLDNYEDVKDRLRIKLINASKNEKLLENCPHKTICDLASIMYILVDDKTLGRGSITIDNDTFARWNKDFNTVHEQARLNSLHEADFCVNSITEILFELMQKRGMDENSSEALALKDMMELEKEGEAKMYVLSNRLRTYGAVEMLDENSMKTFAEQIDSDFYILPSSIHELIVIPANEEINVETLYEMVNTVNEEEVPEYDFLSDNVYYYDRKKCSFSIAV